MIEVFIINAGFNILHYIGRYSAKISNYKVHRNKVSGKIIKKIEPNLF